MTTVELPAPETSAPALHKNAAKSTISGSLAALEITVTPSAQQAASMAFSVAPTLGMDRTISRPRRWWHRQWRLPPWHSTCPPIAVSAARCRSMGLGPSSQPPGMDSSACPIRPRMAPRNTTEERISRMSWSGMSQRCMVLESTVMVSPSCSTTQPRWRRMATEASTSVSWGQLCRTLTAPVKIVAARMGRTLFFAPWTATAPERGVPP